MSDKKILTPYSLNCDSCGATLSYDIINQTYECSFCGNSELSNSRADKIKEWANSLKETLNKDKKIAEYNCSNCGAKLNANTDSQTLHCSFCGSQLIKGEFALSEGFPVGIIPFAINKAEAKHILSTAFANSKSLDKKELGVLKKASSMHMRGVYLPFEMYVGPVDAGITRQDENTFDVKSYMNQKAVIACDDVPNELIDAAEPYDMTKLVPFEFYYLAGQQAKSRERTLPTVEQDFLEETKKDFKDKLKDKLGTEHLKVELNTEKTTSSPILLPVYYMNYLGVQAVVNGQTGKASVWSGKQRIKKPLPWFVEPTIITVIIWIISNLVVYKSMVGGFYRLLDVINALILNYDSEMVPPLIVATLAIFIFSAYGGEKKPIIQNILNSSNVTYKRDKERKLAKDKGLILKNDMEDPVFYDVYNKKRQAVEMKFLPVLKGIFIAIKFFILMFLPQIIAVLLYPILKASGSSGLASPLNIDALSYGAAWNCFSIPATVILYVAVARNRLYCSPFIRPYNTKKIFKVSKSQKIPGVIDFMKILPLKINLIIIAVMGLLLLGSVAAILFA